MVRIHRRWPVLAAVAVLAAACDSGSSEDASSAKSAPASSRPLTEAQADRVLDRYVAANNRANKARDAEQAAAIQDGALHERVLAAYEQYPHMSKSEQGEWDRPYSYIDREYYRPRGADWFMAVGTVADAGEARARHDQPLRRLMVFERDGSGPWRLVLVTTLEESASRLLAGADGSARSADLRAGELARLEEAVLDVTVTGGEKAGRTLDDSTTKEQLADPGGPSHDCLKQDISPADAEHRGSYALRFPGGTLIAFTTEVTVQEYLNDTSDCEAAQMSLPSIMRTYISEPHPRSISRDLLQENAVLVTPEATRLIGHDSSLTGARASSR